MTIPRTLAKIVTLFASFALVLGLISSPALADKVAFGDGNVLQGTVSTFKNGTLVFSTAYAKKVKIPASKIKTIATDEAVTLKMTNDSILTGKLTTLEDGRVAIFLEPMGKTVPFK